MDLYQVSSSDEGECKSDSNLGRTFQKPHRYPDFDRTKIMKEKYYDSPAEDESKPRFDFKKLQRSLDFIQTKSIKENDPGDSTALSTPVEDGIFADLLSTMKSDKFPGTHFISALSQKDSMWISGWDKWRYHYFWQAKLPNFQVLLQRIKYLPKPYSHTIMVSFAKGILFAKKGGRELYSFNTQTETYESVFSHVDFQIDAMCSNDDYLYIFQRKHPDVIKIMDSKFQSIGHIPTGIDENLTDCEVHICTITTSTQMRSLSEYKMKHQHTCIISISNSYYFVMSSHPSPYYPSVRAVNEAGVIWQLDSENCPELGSRFNPCSVSTSAVGDVFIADNGSDRVRVILDCIHFWKTLILQFCFCYLIWTYRSVKYHILRYEESFIETLLPTCVFLLLALSVKQVHKKINKIKNLTFSTISSRKKTKVRNSKPSLVLQFCFLRFGEWPKMEVMLRSC